MLAVGSIVTTWKPLAFRMALTVMAASLDFLAEQAGETSTRMQVPALAGATLLRRCRGRRRHEKIYTISAFAWLHAGHG
jgi:hypothetical protein